MRRLLLSTVFALLALVSVAQPFGNEWVNASQPYFKFPIITEGVHRIGYSTLDQALAQAGFSLTSIDPRNFQVFARGQEQYIYVGGEGDGVFDTNDFIELFARPNDGVIDSALYSIESDHGNPYYSLINDTINYYLTWNSSTNNARMNEETDINFTGYTPSAYMLRDEVDDLHNVYRYGLGYAQVNGGTSPEYSGGEGYLGYYFDGGFTDNAWNLNTSNKYSAGPDAQIEISVVGITPDDKNLTITFAGNTHNEVMQGTNGYRYNYTTTASSLSATTTNFSFDITNTPILYTYWACVAYINIRYPQTVNFNNITDGHFIVDNNPNYPAQAKSYLQSTGFSQPTPRLYDLTNHRRISVGGAPNAYQFLIPDNGQLKHCYLTYEAAIALNQITNLKPAGAGGSTSFTDFNAWDDASDYFAIAHPSLLVEAQAYAAYRNTSGFVAHAIDVEELYAQFGWGIPKHPMAIKNFIRWAKGNLTDPKHVFLIGKSVASLSARTDPAIYSQILVPTCGYPPSDHMFGAFLDGNYEQSPVAIGRLAAKTPQHVSDYLAKMQEYEALAPELWMKTGVHFSGGGTEDELLQIRGFLDTYKTTFEDTLMGGQITTFQKTSSSPYQITQVDSIADIIENGIQLMTFFGHGSSVGFDVSIDHPSTFGNTNGKYPLILANSCYAGDIHQPASAVTSISEEWILEPGKGALGFLATIGPGSKLYLHSFTSKWYKELALNTYAEPVGTVTRNAIAANINPGNPIVRSTNLEFTLHGDPAFNISNRPLPDLTTTQPQIYWNPAEVTTETDSFLVSIIVNNLGAAFSDSFHVEITHQLPTGATDTTINLIHEPVYFIDTINVWLHVDIVDGIGINNICVTLDNLSEIDETNEANNSVCKQLNIISPDIVPIWPYEFAVIGEQNITLKASTGNPFAATRTYRFEVDTTDLFNSPLRQINTVSQSGGVVPWIPTLLANMPDSMVYFWRVSQDSATYGSYKWRESSFQYILSKEGWGQAHYFQFKKDAHDLVVYDRPEREWDFITTAKQIRMNTYATPTTLAEGEQTNYFIDNGREEYLGCTGGNVYTPQLLVIVVDGCTLKPWQTPGIEPVTGAILPGNGAQGQLEPCRGRPEKWYQFGTSTVAQMDAFANFITNVVPDSSYIGIVTWLQVNFSVFQPQYLAPMQALGATQVSTLTGVPYIMFAKKGDPSTIQEVFGTQLSDVISLTTDMVGCWNTGLITTPYIGPASEWGSVHLRSFPQENPTRDSIAVNVIGVRPNGTEQVVINGLDGFSTDLLDLTNYVDATEFPRLRLQAYEKDDSTAATPPQIRRWQVLYDIVPEAALSPNLHLEVSNDSLEQGAEFMFSTAITNISNVDMDSLLVHYWIEDAGGNRHYQTYTRQAPLLEGDVFVDTIYGDASELDGNCRFWVEVNPVPLGTNTYQYDQLEQYHFNNIGSIAFVAQGDDVNPILDVTFDGVHILDGDIVSSKPMIAMELKDENQYKLLNDTADYQIYLKRPNTQTLERIWFQNYQNMQFFPGAAPDNKARIEWKTNFPDDGIHELWVQGTDKANNASGERYLRITFEVINESTISSVLNWPNPFSTATHFVFTLTGSEMPSYFKIQVMTITGKVVREITGPEMGTLHIGRNITPYAWDGKDTYGDRLANGVYLYRVVAKLDGDYIKHRDSGADPWIESGFGKMMLIR